VFDLLASVPFFFIISSSTKYSTKVPQFGYNILYLVYFLKFLRIYKTAKYLDISFINSLVKGFYKGYRDSHIASEGQALKEKDLEKYSELKDSTKDRINI
jgi:hypothetical protein